MSDKEYLKICKEEYIKDYLKLISQRLEKELTDTMSRGEMIVVSFDSIARMNKHILIELLSVLKK